METKYTAARTVMGFIGVVGWVVFGAGVIIVLTVISGELLARGLGIGFGIAAAIGGLIQVAIAQVSVAILDLADNSREALALQRAIADNKGVSQAVAPKPKPAAPVNRPTVATPPEKQKGVTRATEQPPEKRENVEIYMGEEIEYKENRHHWNGQKFLTLGKAKAAVKATKGAGA